MHPSLLFTNKRSPDTKVGLIKFIETPLCLIIEIDLDIPICGADKPTQELNLDISSCRAKIIDTASSPLTTGTVFAYRTSAL